MIQADPSIENRLQQLQAEEMALRTLLDTVSEHTRSDIESLLLMVRQEIDRERTLMQPGDQDEDESVSKG